MLLGDCVYFTINVFTAIKLVLIFMHESDSVINGRHVYMFSIEDKCIFQTPKADAEVSVAFNHFQHHYFRVKSHVVSTIFG